MDASCPPDVLSQGSLEPATASHEDDERWLPIETAPKDGTPILIAQASTGSMRWAVWSNGFWRDGQASAGGVICGCPCPTHWMPLPPAPEELCGAATPGTFRVNVRVTAAKRYQFGRKWPIHQLVADACGDHLTLRIMSARALRNLGLEVPHG